MLNLRKERKLKAGDTVKIVNINAITFGKEAVICNPINLYGKFQVSFYEPEGYTGWYLPEELELDE